MKNVANIIFVILTLALAVAAYTVLAALKFMFDLLYNSQTFITDSFADLRTSIAGLNNMVLQARSKVLDYILPND